MACEEIFGPVVTIHAFEDEDDMLKQVNHVKYGCKNKIFFSFKLLFFFASLLFFFSLSLFLFGLHGSPLFSVFFNLNSKNSAFARRRVSVEEIIFFFSFILCSSPSPHIQQIYIYRYIYIIKNKFWELVF